MFPLGVHVLLKLEGRAKIVVLVWCTFGLYFASMMVRLVVVFIPAFILVASLAIDKLVKNVRHRMFSYDSVVGLALVFVFAVVNVTHVVFFAFGDCTNTTINHDVRDGHEPVRSDDHREMFRWIAPNTNKKVLSLWDTGYLLSSMAQAVTYGDGYTSNFTHVALASLLYASEESVSWKLARMLDVDYMCVTFGGASGLLTDDVNKFTWFVEYNVQRSFPNVSVNDFHNPESSFLVAPVMPEAVTTSTLFKTSYYNFRRFQLNTETPKGTDIARNTSVGSLDIDLSLFEEAYTTKHWLMRCYKVIDDPIWDCPS